jgi:hypothetical protein
MFWENLPQDSMVFLCPVQLDSIHWMTRDAVDVIDADEIAAGRARFSARLDLELSRWASFALRSPRPREFRARRLVVQHGGIDPSQHAMADSLARAALESHQEALSLSRDTTPEQWIRLGSLLLANAREGEALAATERGIEDLVAEGRNVLTLEELNIFVAIGRLERGLEVIDLVHGAGERFTDSEIPGVSWPAEELRRAQMLGSVGIADARLGEAFADMERLWTRRQYPEAARRGLRQQLTAFVAHSLLLDDAIRDDWFEGLIGVDVWRRMLSEPVDPASARALAETGELRNSGVARYVLGVRLRRAGYHEAAIEYLDSFLRWPLWIDTFDPRWGLRSLALLERARARQGANDGNGAEADYAAFMNVWEQADPELRVTVREAKRALTDIHGVSKPLQ